MSTSFRSFQKSCFTLVIAVMVSAALGACTAKRQSVFSQGQGTNLDRIDSWKERMIPLTTGEVIGTASTTRAQDSVKVSEKVKTMNHFDLVQIKVEDPAIAKLVGSPPFRAKPNSQGVYELRVKLTENHLKFYKVALPENLPFDEHAYREETLSDGRIAIPLLGFRISGYFHVEPVRTGDGQESNQLIEIQDVDHAKSTHVKIDWSSRELFQAVKTADLMPSGLFFAREEGKGFQPFQWYYAETVIEKSLNDRETIVGETASRSEKSELVPASKVVILPRESELRIVNVARDERLSLDQIQSSGDLNSEAALIIPVKWMDLRTKSEGTSLALQGETVEERKWSQRSSLELNLPELRSTRITEGQTRLLDLEIDQNYFSFTVLNLIGNKGRKIHYSFLRADQGRAPYQPRMSFKGDRSLFGFFTSEKPFIPNWEYYTEQNFDQRIYMSRMNPDAGEIVFHLSAGSPAWLEDIAERAVMAWDRTFQKAMEGTGKELKVRFSKERVQLGDLRYNVIHLVETLSEDGLLGFGPSVADPETGEIISATTNVYVNSTQAIAAGTVRQYMIDRLEKRLGKKAEGTPLVSESEGSAVGEKRSTLSRLMELAKNPERMTQKQSTQNPFSIADLKKDLQAMSREGCHFAEQAVMGTNDRDIQKYCPEVESLVDRYADLDVTSREASKGNWEKIWSESRLAIKECSIKITRGKLLSTLIHELGHNLGLRHNFYASYDKANFKTSTSIFGETIEARSSSIMEYTDWDEDRLTETGKYDLAAIRFGYAERVELQDGSIVKVDSTKSLDAKSLKSYLFCTDEEAYTGLNALCKPHDAGTSPSELVDFYIKGYKRSEALRKLRRARPMNSDPEAIAYGNLSRTFMPLKDIYDEWRYQLGEYVRKSNRYLSDYDTKSYPSVLEAMSKDPQYGPVFEQYYEAAEKIYAFFKDVAFGPNEYCLIEDSGETRAIELERLRDLLSEATRGSVAIRSCEDAVTASDLATVISAKAPKVLAQVGYPIHSYRFEKASQLSDYIGVDAEDQQREKYDVVGNRMTRYFAGLLIHHRMDNVRNFLSQFAPNMTDEPNHYLDFAQTLLGRMIEGVDLSAYGVETAQPLFAQEGNLIANFASFFQVGLYTPGDRLSDLNKVATGRKLAPFAVYRLTQADDPKKFAAVLSLNGRNAYGAIQKGHVLAFNLINRFNEIDRMLDLEEVSTKAQGQVLGMLLKYTPSAAELPFKTITDYAMAFQALDKVREAFPEFTACIEENVPTFTQMSGLMEKIGTDYQAAQEVGDAEVKKFLALNLVEYVTPKLEGKEFLFTKESLKGLPQVVSACAGTQAEKVRKLNRNRKDYESQKSMILDVLGAYAD